MLCLCVYQANDIGLVILSGDVQRWSRHIQFQIEFDKLFGNKQQL